MICEINRILRKDEQNIIKIIFYDDDANLLCEHGLKKRIDAYLRVAKDCNSAIPTTSIDVFKSKIEIKQQYISRNSFTNTEYKELYPCLIGLKQTMRKLHDEGFVHGDICRKNIRFAESRFYLIDFEPFLIVNKNGKLQYRATHPYLHDDDRNAGQVTKKTDLLGYKCFAKHVENPTSLPHQYARSLIMCE